MKLESIHLGLVVACVVVLGGVVRGDDPNYAAQLAQALSQKSDHEITEVLGSIVDHAHSEDKHVSFPDLSKLQGDRGDEVLHSELRERVSAHFDDLEKTAAEALMRNLKNSGKGDRLANLSKDVLAGTKSAIRVAENHEVKIQQIEDLAYDVTVAVRKLEKVSTSVGGRLKEFEDLVAQMEGIAQDMSKQAAHVKAEMQTSEQWAIDVGASSKNNIVWYYIILLQLFAFVGYIFYRRSKLRFKLGGLAI